MLCGQGATWVGLYQVLLGPCNHPFSGVCTVQEFFSWYPGTKRSNLKLLHFPSSGYLPILPSPARGKARQCHSSKVSRHTFQFFERFKLFNLLDSVNSFVIEGNIIAYCSKFIGRFRILPHCICNFPVSN